MDTVGLMDGKMPTPTPGIVPNEESLDRPVSVKNLTQLVYRRTEQRREMSGGKGRLVKESVLCCFN
ncbi:MAG: hypothetical protein IPM81_19775 [Saprospirales bacterium]|jgi:hypothetical protein|nr:hypothetical protein [Saprospirales bacterium]